MTVEEAEEIYMAVELGIANQPSLKDYTMALLVLGIQKTEDKK